MNPYLIIQPVITEKTLLLVSNHNAYTFQVQRSASKQQIKDAVQATFNVEVMSVNTIFGHKSTKATGKKRLQRPVPRTKKAVITLKSGQKIELFDIQTNTEGAAA